MLLRIMGLLCAGMGLPRGRVEAAEVQSSRFFCAKGPACLCIHLILKQGKGMGVLKPLSAAQKQLSSRGGFKTGCGDE